MNRSHVILLFALLLLVGSILTSCGGSVKDTAEWHTEQGDKLIKQDRYEEAIEEYTKAIELDPNLAKAYKNRGLAYFSLGRTFASLDQLERAIGDFDEAIRLNPEDAVAYTDRGTTLVMLGGFNRAIRDFDEAIRLDPEYAVAYLGRGVAYKEQGKKAEAMADFEKFISLTNNPRWIEEAKQEIEELSE